MNIMQPGIPPHNEEAELSILGSILQNNHLLDECTDLSKDDFYSELYGVIFETMADMYDRNEPIDLVTLKENMGSVLTSDVIFAISETFAPASAFRYHKKIIKENSIKRKIMGLGHDLLHNANEAEEVEELLQKAEDTIYNLRQQDTAEYIPVKKGLITVYQDIIDRQKNPGKLKGVSTGFQDIDAKLNGLQKKKLYYLAARPAMGKTSLAMQIGVNVAKQGIPVAVFSLEMGKEELIEKILSQEARIPNENIEKGELSEAQAVELMHAGSTIHSLPFFICDQSGLTARQIKSIAQRVKRENKGLGLVIIDYLQYIAGKGESARIIVENNSKALKQLSKDLDVPVLCLSQLSRACEVRNDKRPLLSDLRETGGIEQDADVAAFLYRDEYYEPDTEKKGIAEFIIRKNRGGSLGTVELVFIANMTVFASLSRREARM